MKDVLEEIVAHKRLEVAALKAATPLGELAGRVEPLLATPVPSMRQALRESRSGIIAEFKRKSPSRGWIHADAQPEQVTPLYERYGAAALSILTDEKYFGGNDDFVVRTHQLGVKLPILYKNFVIDEYQLYQARLCGASAVLLIAADLSLDECRTLLGKAHELGLEVLLEMHGERDLDYAALEPDMCGINNRNLGTFVTDVHNSFAMAERLPREAVKVSESGISDPAVVRQLCDAGYCGFLIGERFMSRDNPGVALREFIEAL